MYDNRNYLYDIHCHFSHIVIEFDHMMALPVVWKLLV